MEVIIYEDHRQARKGPLARWLAASVLATALVLSAGVTLRAQSAPNPPAPPEARPEPPSPPELPEPSDPSEPPQFFVFNDRSMHLGVALDDVTPEKARELKLPSVAGALVAEVQKDSAAEKAGLRVGDVITEFDGIHVRGAAELQRLIRETPSGRTVEIAIFRDGFKHTLSAKLEAAENQFSYNYKWKRDPQYFPQIIPPPGAQTLPQMIPPPMARRGTLGIQGDDLTPQLARYFGVSQGAGVLVFEVTLGGAADKAGIKAGDVITQVDGKPVRGVDGLRRAINENFRGETRTVSLTIVRDRRELTLTAELNHAGAEEYHTFLNLDPGIKSALTQLPAATQEIQAQTDGLRDFANGQLEGIQSRVMEQQKYLQKQWQEELQKELRSLKNLQVPKPQFTARLEDEI